MAPTAKPGPTCLFHGSHIPDANTSCQARTQTPSTVGLPSDPDNPTGFHIKLANTTTHSKPLKKPQDQNDPDFQFGVPIDRMRYPDVLDMCQRIYQSYPDNSNIGFADAVLRDFAPILQIGFGAHDIRSYNFPNVNRNGYRTYFAKTHSPAQAKGMASKGNLVFAGVQGYQRDWGDSKKKGSLEDAAKLAVVVSGPLDNAGLPTGYWGKTDTSPAGKGEGLSKLFTPAEYNKITYAIHTLIYTI